ncbi:hypothetical protein MSBRW_2674 [Methanosarcina barkeri str. Wiesmoor]|uniref:Uncharacterized protein n=2 Tax=Methanosarcina barkeri TaxID=2208 RepID=A0A0E3QLP1_METBA|nr:DUF6345 domain-containing protein [Methanosarcina barkeri]AKB51927.1 hypothetical protein MSBRW_2674 [Methanosarcina barkeri str. Wiesmoor]
MDRYKIVCKIMIFVCICTFATQTASAYSYSVTIIENYSVLNSLAPHGTENYGIVENWLHDVAGWNEYFYDSETNVDETDFGTLDSGYQGLDDADFHYHLGHGVDDIGTEIALYNWLPGYNYNDVRAQDVYKKWDNNNEWVLLHSCHILDDYNDWAGALEYSHGILGFTTEAFTNEELVDKFFTYTIDDDDEICDAWWFATVETFESPVRAAMIADTDNQYVYDHLNGQGTMQPDEYPDDSLYAYGSWRC